LMVLQNAPRSELKLPGLRLGAQEMRQEAAQFDLSLSFGEAAGGEIGGSLSYACDLFKQETIRRWVGYLQTILMGMVADASRRVGALELLPVQEKHQVLQEFNATRVEYPQGRVVHELFEEQVGRTPQAPAVCYEGEQLSYAELNARANQLAAYLREQGVSARAAVALMLPRGTQLVVAQLAVLKAGGVYVPIDPEQPASRQSHMLLHCGAGWVLGRGQDGVQCQARWIDLSLGEWLTERYSQADTAGCVAADDVAYVMYTSGSTGDPKGVEVTHRGVIKLAIRGGYAEVTAKDCLVHCSNTAFDASTFEVWAGLLNGARVLLAPAERVLEPDRFVHTMREHGVTVLHLTTALFNQYAAALQPLYGQLRYLLFGGEAADATVVREVLGAGYRGHLVHLYGPTETTAFASAYRVISVADDVQRIPIGQPISNTQIYVLDAAGEPVPIGVTGEIYIGGAGVARGYLKQPGLTAQRFVADEFSGRAGARLYRTGDLGRWRAEGTLEYLGRNDQQVKIRGYRIELGEIESQLGRHPQVREAVVLAHELEGGAKRLVAYVSGEGLRAEGLREYLRERVPEYMVPAAYVVLEQMPLTSNGKVDRRALPAPDETAYGQRGYEEPQGELEAALAQIWSQLLQVERIGRHDNFFELGGHSLLATAVLQQVRQLGFTVPLRVLFQHPVLMDFAHAAQTLERESTIENPILLKEGGSQRPLFLVHNGSGQITSLIHLLKHLGEEISVYGLVLTGQPPPSLAVLAREHVEAMISVQPHGPYRIAGHSLGGLIAYEIAAQLLARDESVEFVGLIDATFPLHTMKGVEYVHEMRVLAEHVRSVLPQISREMFERICNARDLESATVEAERCGLLLSNIELREIQRITSIHRVFAAAVSEYVVYPLSIPIDYLASEEVHASKRRVYAEWLEVEDLNVRWQEIGGSHNTMLHEPHVARLGEEITTRLRSASQSGAASRQPLHSCLIPLHSLTNCSATVFCVPGAGASVACFLPLAEELAEGMSVYALQPRGLEGSLVPHATVEAAAAEYVDSIWKAGVNGHIHLIGHSYGAWVAFELTNRLATCGVKVTSVTLLDPEAPGITPADRPSGRVGMLMQLVELLEQGAETSLDIVADDLERSSAQEQQRFLLQRMISKGLMPMRTTARTMRGLVRVFAANFSCEYHPTRCYEGPTVMINVESNDPATSAQDTLGDRIRKWQEYAPNLAVKSVRGNHVSMLKRPNVRLLAQQVKDFWAEVLV
jgi:amino acid adenylation domain-containing protein